MPGAKWFSRRTAQPCRKPAPVPRQHRGPHFRRRGQGHARSPMPSFPTRWRGSQKRSKSLRIEPGDRIVGFMPNMPRDRLCHAGRHESWSGVVLLFPRLRDQGGPRPFRPDQAEGSSLSPTGTGLQGNSLDSFSVSDILKDLLEHRKVGRGNPIPNRNRSSADVRNAVSYRIRDFRRLPEI